MIDPRAATRAAELHFSLVVIRRALAFYRGELEQAEMNLKDPSAVHRMHTVLAALRAAETSLAVIPSLEFPAEMMRLSLSVVRDQKSCEEVSRG